jgi:acetoin utilization protein AcuB
LQAKAPPEAALATGLLDGPAAGGTMSRSHPQIKDYMSSHVHSIGADQKLSHAHEVMRMHHIRHLPVLQGGKLVGIISERDVFWMETLKDGEGDEMLIEEGMTPLPYSVSPEAPLAEVAREMAENKYGAAVVISGGDVVGVFTTVDALRALATTLSEPSIAPPPAPIAEKAPAAAPPAAKKAAAKPAAKKAAAKPAAKKAAAKPAAKKAPAKPAARKAPAKKR